MSKLGFDTIIQNLDTIEKNFLKKGIAMAQIEFKRNFDTQSNNETNDAWDSPIRRNPPPPVLNVKGRLKRESLVKGNEVISKGKAVLTIDPIDDRGRGYASFHQSGFTHTSGRFVRARSFVTQSNALTILQTRILENEVEAAFSGYNIRKV